MLTDHRTDVRMILTQEQQWSRTTASMETANGRDNTEAAFYSSKVADTRVPISDIPGQSANAGWQANSSAYVSKLSSARPVGPNQLLKVMAGDLLHTQVQYYYPAAITNSNTSSLASSVATMLATALAGNAGATNALKNSATAIGTALGSSPDFTSFINNYNSNNSGTQPKAFLNVLFFDERFTFVQEASTSQRVATAGDGAAPLVLLNIKAPANGYCFVYLSNESDQAVYFDNLQVRHDRGRILEENHYYAYGLKIAALSSKAYAAPANNYQYQGDYAEFDDDLGWNDFMLRSYDPQLGRFLQSDPYDQFASGYVGMGDDPVNNVDPTGGWGGPITSAIRQVACPGSGGNLLTTLSTVASIMGTASHGASVLGLTVRPGALSQWHVGPGGNIFRPGGLARYAGGLRLGSTIAGVLYTNPAGEGSDLSYIRHRNKTERDREFLERTIWRIEWGSDGEDEYFGEDATGEQYRTKPFSPDAKPPVDPYGRDTYFIYETLRKRKGVVRPYYGITKLRGRGSDGRYGRKTLEGMNMTIIGFTYTKKMAQGIEQNLIELNSDGGRPSRSERIDNLDNSLDPSRVDYPIFKFMGGKWLDYFYPKWREMGTPGQRGQFLRPIKN